MAGGRGRDARDRSRRSCAAGSSIAGCVDARRLRPCATRVPQRPRRGRPRSRAREVDLAADACATRRGRRCAACAHARRNGEQRATARAGRRDAATTPLPPWSATRRRRRSDAERSRRALDGARRSRSRARRRRAARCRSARSSCRTARSSAAAATRRSRQATRPRTPRSPRCATPDARFGNYRLAGLRALRDARALRDVRRRDPARADRARSSSARAIRRPARAAR